MVSHAVWDQKNNHKIVTSVISCKIQKANSHCLCKRRNWIGSQYGTVSLYLDPDPQVMLVQFPLPLGSAFPESSFIHRQTCALRWSLAAGSFALTSVAAPASKERRGASFKYFCQSPMEECPGSGLGGVWSPSSVTAGSGGSKGQVLASISWGSVSPERRTEWVRDCHSPEIRIQPRRRWQWAFESNR